MVKGTYFLFMFIFLCFSSKICFSCFRCGSYVTPMFLRSSSYDPIVPERIYNGPETDLERR